MNTQHPQTLFDLLAVGDPAHPALMVPEGGPAVTYRSLRNQVEGLAATLHALGLGRGDRVAMAREADEHDDRKKQRPRLRRSTQHIRLRNSVSI